MTEVVAELAATIASLHMRGDEELDEADEAHAVAAAALRRKLESHGASGAQPREPVGGWSLRGVVQAPPIRSL